jgi:hypothetical protein
MARGAPGPITRSYVMRSDGDNQHRLQGVSGCTSDCCPAWRPDESRT